MLFWTGKELDCSMDMHLSCQESIHSVRAIYNPVAFNGMDHFLHSSRDQLYCGCVNCHELRLKIGLAAVLGEETAAAHIARQSHTERRYRWCVCVPAGAAGFAVRVLLAAVAFAGAELFAYARRSFSFSAAWASNFGAESASVVPAFFAAGTWLGSAAWAGFDWGGFGALGFAATDTVAGAFGGDGGRLGNGGFGNNKGSIEDCGFSASGATFGACGGSAILRANLLTI